MTQSPPGTEPSTVALEVLTDEELAILAGPDDIAVLPFLETVPEAEREAVTRTAYRGLLARGIVDPPTPEATAAALERGEGAASTVELMVRQDVLTVVTLRRSARSVVALARTTAVGQDFWYAHVVDDICLLEEVSSDGLHRFAVCRTSDLPDRVVDAAVHPEAGDADGEPVEVTSVAGDPTPPDEVLARLGESLLRVDMVVRTAHDSHPPLLGLFTGPGGSWCSVSRAGSGGPVVVEPCSAEELRRRVRTEAERES